MQKIAITVAKQSGDDEYFIERVKDYIDFGNDEDMKSQLVDIFNIFK